MDPLFDYEAIAIAIVTGINEAVNDLPIDATPLEKQTEAMKVIVEGILGPVAEVIEPLLGP